MIGWLIKRVILSKELLRFMEDHPDLPNVRISKRGGVFVVPEPKR